MLRLAGGQVESLLDELLPVEVRELPADLAVLDRLLADPRLLAPIEQAWEWTARRHGRPTIPMGCFVRLMVIKYPTDAGLAWQGARALAREGRKLAGRLRGQTRRVVDRSRQLGKTVRAISRTLARRTGQRRDEVMELNAKAGRILARSIREARALATQARAAARGRGARAKLRAAQRLEELADRCQRIATQIQQRSRGEKITDRLVSLSDPDARPIRKGQLAEVTANTGRGARGYLLPAATAAGNPAENRLLAQTAAELDRLGLRPREVTLDGGFVPSTPADKTRIGPTSHHRMPAASPPPIYPGEVPRPQEP